MVNEYLKGGIIVTCKKCGAKLTVVQGKQTYIGLYNGQENFKWKEVCFCPNKKHFWDGHTSEAKIKYLVEKEK